jgi:hypothetical protein
VCECECVYTHVLSSVELVITLNLLDYLSGHKTRLFLGLIQRNAIKSRKRAEACTSILNLSSGWRSVFSFLSLRLLSVPGTKCTGGCVHLKAGTVVV